MDNFMKRFNFRKEGAGLIGVEREGFIINGTGKITPMAARILQVLTDRSRFGYELSACQLEDRIGPVPLDMVHDKLLANERDIREVEKQLNFHRRYVEVVPEGMMPLDVYPDPTGRYQQIVKNMPEHILSAACRVTGTHIHVGMPDHESALKTYNGVIRHLDKLCQKGDKSNGERLSIYKVMAPDYSPPQYGSWTEFFKKATSAGFVEDPRKCWHLIRISVHGTIEFRMFGSTEDINEIVDWAEECHGICCEALDS